jgi:hypothetical protein
VRRQCSYEKGGREVNEKKYEEVGTMYRFYLGWRHAAFAGHVVIIYGVLSLALSNYKADPMVACGALLIGAVVGLLLWVIDKRTRDLYHAAIRAGKHLEGKTGGFFTELSKDVLPAGSSPFKKISHSMALDVLFIGSFAILFILAIAIYVMPL